MDYEARRLTKDRPFTEGLEAVDATGGRVAMVSATLQLLEAPTIQAQLESW